MGAPPVISAANVVLQPLHQMWPMQRKPSAAFTDFVGQYASLGFPQIGASGLPSSQSQFMEFNPVASCVYARRMFVPHNNTLPTGYYSAPPCPNSGNPSVSWTLTYHAPASLGSQIVTSQTRAPGYCECAALLAVNTASGALQLDASGSDLDSTWLEAFSTLATPAQGFVAMVMPVFPAFGETDSDWRDVTFALRWRLFGSQVLGPYGRWFSLSFRPLSDIRLGYNDTLLSDGQPDPNGWVWLDDPAPGADLGTLTAGQPATQNWLANPGGPTTSYTRDYSQDIVVEVLLIGGSMMVNIGSGHTPWLIPMVGADTQHAHYWGIDSLAVVSAGCLHQFWSVHLTKFRPWAKMLSAEQNLGFVPDPAQTETYRVHCAPDFGGPRTAVTTGWLPYGSSVAAYRDSINGTNLVYALEISNAISGTWQGQDYADYSAAVGSVSAFMPGLAYSKSGSALTVYPELIQVSHAFSLSDLSISSHADLTFNNFHGDWTNSSGTGFLDTHGHVGVTVDLGTLPGPGPFRQFTGIANTRFHESWPGHGQNHVTVSCGDGWLPLNTPRWNLPWMDGWNVLYALAWLAMHGGVTPSRIAWMSSVPADPYDPNADSSPSYFLPLGPAGTPLTRYTGGQLLSSIMRKIANSIGCALYFDVFGVLTLQKFAPPPGSVANKTFYAWGMADHSEILAGGNFVSDLSEVRNAVTVIGVNAMGPLWNPVVAHVSDENSVWDDSASNFLGYYNPLVWADNIFADIDFASQAAQAMLGFLRLPAKTVSFTSWIPPDVPIYPLDLVKVVNPKSGAGSTLFNTKGFLVLSVGYRMRKGEPPTVSITGRWMPN